MGHMVNYKPKTFSTIGKPAPEDERHGEEEMIDLDVDQSKGQELA